jgi:hypothetical protein
VSPSPATTPRTAHAAGPVSGPASGPHPGASAATDAPAEAGRPTTDPLEIVALDVERHVARAGWDQPARLFALVPTAELLAQAPGLDADLPAQDLAPGALSAVEQEDLDPGAGIEELLGRMAWPPSVAGTLLVVERIVVPPEAERDLPGDAAAATALLAAHPDRQDVRLAVAVTRAGGQVCLLRQRAHDRDDRVAAGRDIAPGLVAALRATLED